MGLPRIHGVLTGRAAKSRGRRCGGSSRTRHRSRTQAVRLHLAGVPGRAGHGDPRKQTASTPARCSGSACTCCSSSSTAPGTCTWRASSITPGAWVTQQARNLLVNPERSGRRPKFSIRGPGRQVHRGVGHGIHGHRHSDHQDPVQAPKDERWRRQHAGSAGISAGCPAWTGYAWLSRVSVLGATEQLRPDRQALRSASTAR